MLQTPLFSSSTYQQQQIVRVVTLDVFQENHVQNTSSGRQRVYNGQSPADVQSAWWSALADDLANGQADYRPNGYTKNYI
jgi:hypothetical protein